MNIKLGQIQISHEAVRRLTGAAAALWNSREALAESALMRGRMLLRRLRTNAPACALLAALTIAGISQRLWQDEPVSWTQTAYLPTGGGMMLADNTLTTPVPVPVPVPGAVAAPARPVGPAWLHLDVRRGDTFSSLLSRANIAGDEAYKAIEALSAVFNPRDLRVGQKISVSVDPAQGLKSFAFKPDVVTEISVSRDAAESFRAARKDIPLTLERRAATGEIYGSLAEATSRAGVPASVLADIIRAYSFSVDFQRDIQPGDAFSVFYEQMVTEDGTSTGRTALVFASLKVNGKELAIYRHKLLDGSYEMVDVRGQSIRKGLLRTPIDGARVSSGFGTRIHPILGYSKMHKGVDFAAPRGTPIYAAGDGVVKSAGWQGAYGRIVVLRHQNGLETAYAHMSKFAAGIKPGTRVRQRQVIGYVGSTGRSTGPHLHYEVRVGGRAQNPLKVTLPAGPRLTGREMERFNAARDLIDAEFQSHLRKEALRTASAL